MHAQLWPLILFSFYSQQALDAVWHCNACMRRTASNILDVPLASEPGAMAPPPRHGGSSAFARRLPTKNNQSMGDRQSSASGRQIAEQARADA
jgi:hypothetical protein